jgi:tetratricopeptide (TPR) repeat protein
VLAELGLEAAHAKGLVHRDFKPDNVLVGWDGRVCVVDFGLAQGALDADLERLPQDTAVAGTPAYMAPEQRQGAPADARSDQYSFCVALFEALVGARPEGPVRTQASNTPSHFALRLPSGASLPTLVRRALARGLSEDPARRYPDMGELLDALRAGLALRARFGWSAAIAAGLAAAAVGGHAYSTHAQGMLCRGAAQRLSAVWTPARAQTLEQAFLRTDAQQAQAQWKRAFDGLDAYARAWAAQRTEACEATRLRGEQSEQVLDTRMHCFDRRLDELAALLDVFALADTSMVARSTESVKKLTPLDTCAASAEVPAPSQRPSPEQKARIGPIEAQLARGKALRDTGQYPRAAEVLARAVADARALGHRPTEAEALLGLGRVQVEAKAVDEVETTLFEAFRAASAARLDEAATRAAVLQVKVTGRWLRKPEDSRRWEQLAESNLERLGGNGELEGQLLLAKGYNALARGALDEALALRAEGVDKLERALGPESVELADALAELCYTQYAARKLEPGAPACHRSLRILEQTYGPEHPLIARPLTSLGAFLSARGQYDDALPHFERAAKVARLGLGPDSADLAIYENNVGYTLSVLGRYAEARTHLEEAVALHERTLGPTHPDLAYDLVNLARTLHGLGQNTNAEARARRALAILEKGGPTQVRLDALTLLGRLALSERRPRDAEALFRDAVALSEKTYGAQHYTVSTGLTGLGKALLQSGRAAAAQPLLRRAQGLREKHEGVDPLDLGETRFLLAQALWANGGPRSEARALAQAARTGLQGVGHRAAQLLADLEAWVSSRGLAARSP